MATAHQIPAVHVTRRIVVANIRVAVPDPNRAAPLPNRACSIRRAARTPTNSPCLVHSRRSDGSASRSSALRSSALRSSALRSSALRSSALRSSALRSSAGMLELVRLRAALTAATTQQNNLQAPDPTTPHSRQHYGPSLVLDYSHPARTLPSLSTMPHTRAPDQQVPSSQAAVRGAIANAAITRPTQA